MFGDQRKRCHASAPRRTGAAVPFIRLLSTDPLLGSLIAPSVGIFAWGIQFPFHHNIEKADREGLQKEVAPGTKSLDATGLTNPLDFTGPKNTAATSVRVVQVDPNEGKITPVTGFVSYR